MCSEVISFCFNSLNKAPELCSIELGWTQQGQGKNAELLPGELLTEGAAGSTSCVEPFKREVKGDQEKSTILVPAHLLRTTAAQAVACPP